MKKIKTYANIIFVFIILVIGVITINQAIKYDTKEPKMEIYANNNYSETLVIVADQEYPPFSFENSHGVMIGSNIELMNAIANEMHVNLDFKFVPWSTSLEMINDGSADIILGLEYNDEYKEKFELSKPVEVNQYVAFGKEDYISTQELFDKKIAVLEYSSVMESIVEPMGFPNVNIYKEYEDAFIAIEENEADYLLARYPVGNRVLANNDFKNIKAVGHVLYSNSYCFGVQKGNEQLINRVNSAIEKCREDSTMQNISTKWLGDFINVTSFVDLIKTHLTTFSLLIVFIILLICAMVYQRIVFHKRKSQNDLATGILNKQTTTKYIQRKIKHRGNGVVLLMDIDNFKEVNDHLGHVVGDECIILIANTMKKIFRKNDIIGRIGGDEFMVYLHNVSSAKVAIEKGKLLQKEISAWSEQHHSNFKLTLSVGIAMTYSNMNFKTLYENVDYALYQAKKLGKNQIYVISNTIEEDSNNQDR